MTDQIEKQNVARRVREAIHSLPPFDNMTLAVDEQGIAADTVGNVLWWRVPVIPSPWPSRMSRLYDALAEIEEQLQEGQGQDILLYPGGSLDNASELPTAAPANL